MVLWGLPVAALGGLAGCTSTQASPERPEPAGAAPATAARSHAAITHIHHAARDRGTVLVATHEGLFRLTAAGRLVAQGPPNDLMGFAIAADGTYLASGHPAPGSDLPQPLGLIQSTDRGRTWSLRSRGGESDFHALAALGPGVMAFDGALWFSPDHLTWQSRQIPAPPRELAAGPDGTVLATTERGLLASADRGLSWQTMTTPQLLSSVAWAGPRTIVGASTKGVLMLSRDSGATWAVGPRSVGDVSALSATLPGGDQLEILLVVGTQVISTGDLGARTLTLV